MGSTTCLAQEQFDYEILSRVNQKELKLREEGDAVDDQQ